MVELLVVVLLSYKLLLKDDIQGLLLKQGKGRFFKTLLFEDKYFSVSRFGLKNNALFWNESSVVAMHTGTYRIL